jgi:hypothetical protein
MNETPGAGATPAEERVAAAIADIRRIEGLDDAIHRNLLITKRYHELSHDLARVIRGTNCNWSTFACWASKTAGQSIRQEELPGDIVQVLKDEARFEECLATLTRPLPFLRFLHLDLNVFQVARAVVTEVSRQIAAGNLKVFAELAPFFARFSIEFADPAARTPRSLDAFLERLRSGPAERDGQDWLKLAFRRYFAAIDAPNDKQRAEHILLGNLLIGLHEQTRLQPNIQAGIDAPLSDAVLRESAGLAGISWLRPLTRRLFGHRLSQFRDGVQDGWERVVTRFFMRLALPNGQSLSLAEDVPVTGRTFPPDLDPLLDAELSVFVGKYDRDPRTTRGSGAHNWTQLAQRMSFIIDLFRSHQQSLDLFGPPFDPMQCQEIEAGRVPRGPL